MPYDLQDIRAPRLVGVALQAVVAAVENRASASLLIPRLLADTGVAAFRAAVLEEPPSVLPDLPRPGSLPELPPPLATDRFALAEEAPRPEGHVFESAGDYARAYRAGRLTPVEVARRLVSALREGEAQRPPLRAMIAWREEDLLAQARASEARWKEGRPRSPLDGVPIAVKDELDQAGYPTTAGTSFLAKVAATDAAVVTRLREAGALLYGKSNMIEIGIDTLGFNPHHGTPRNPYGRSPRYSGGSSSGSGVAVAAGLGPIAVGADGGGSVRIPAALCGVVGLKATHGRLSERGAFPLCWSVGHIGPIGATVRDVALAYDVMAGPVEGDPLSQAQPPPTLAGLGEGVAGLRIGVYRPWFTHADALVVRHCRNLVDGLVAAGATVVEVELPDLELCRVAHAVTILCEMATTMDRHVGNLGQHGLAVRINLALARALTGRDYVRAQMVRTRMSRHFARVFESCDVIATPTTAIVAPPFRDDVAPRGESNLEVVSALMRFVAPLNLTGHPALSVPAGYDADGLPIGLQLIGRPWEEHVLLRAGEATERLVARRKPDVGFRLLE
jgi:Asp-tRNA(Asn)/Glu-tRNA(Gln) amidotransferase A subunit family amidase